MKSLRLKTIANQVKENSIVADIGTDHGYIPVYLIENGISKKIIATDISKGSLKKIKDHIRLKGMEEEIETRLGDGLDVVKEYEVDTVIMAGMGGILIRDILSKNPKKTESINNFILQPMLGAEELRKYLVENNFEILKNIIIKEDGKFYEIIYARVGKTYIENSWELEIPKEYIKDDPITIEFIKSKLNYVENIRESIIDKNSENVKERLKELDKSIYLYREVLKRIENKRINS